MFRYCRIDGATVTTVAEGLIYPDDLPARDADGFAQLQAYARTHKADVDLTYLVVEPNWELELLSGSEFLTRWLWRVGYRHTNRPEPALIVMFNAPFDLSRLALGVSDARDDMYGGFSLVLWTDKNGEPAPWRPRVAVKSLDSKRAIKKFRRLERGGQDFAGHLLDLRTLVFALTGDSHSLDSACRAFNVEGKSQAPEFGLITEEAVDYCRQDVTATTGLLEAVLTEYARHPIALQPTVAYSPASVAKAYLKAMGLSPRLTSQPDFPNELLGHAMSAFYGGRAEVHLRHVPVPVQVVDFTSMYPTVDILLGLWRLVTAERIDTVDVTEEIGELLETVTVADCYEPALWSRLNVLVQIRPAGDVVPVRATYRGTDELSIGVNPLHSEQPMWFTLPDLIASRLLSGRTPTVLRAVRFDAVGRQDGLSPVALHGDVTVDPASEDFFRRVVQERQRAKRRVQGHPKDCSCSGCRLTHFLKVLANSGSYGIYAEMIRHELPAGTRAPVTVYPPSGTPFDTRVSAPEEPGEFCFPPIAAVITGAARLMLALLERAVTDAGGAWVFCDTDSMAIVATDTGALLACPGGEQRLPDGIPAIKALTFTDVETIRRRFDQLNPYDREAVPELLKREERGLCYAIAAKRYVLYAPSPDGGIDIIKASEHGLGRFLDPLSPHTERRVAGGGRQWIHDAWTWILTAHDDPDAPLPAWADLPALSRVSVSSPVLLRPFAAWNAGRPWDQQVKPFNFLLAATLHPFGKPTALDETDKIRLIAPYSSDPDDWMRLDWRNLYDPAGPAYRITTHWDPVTAEDVAIVQSYADALRAYRLHPEAKFLGPDGRPCGRTARGVLRRRPVHVVGPPTLISKEANRLDDVQHGLIDGIDEVLTTYNNLAEDALLRDLALPVLARYSGRDLAKMVGCDHRTIDRIRLGQRPRSDLRARLLDFAIAKAQADLAGSGAGVDLQGRALPDPGHRVLAAWRALPRSRKP